MALVWFFLFVPYLLHERARVEMLSIRGGRFLRNISNIEAIALPDEHNRRREVCHQLATQLPLYVNILEINTTNISASLLLVNLFPVLTNQSTQVRP